MNFRKGCFGFSLALVLGLLACGTASANPVNMDFDGLTPGTSVHTYYDGGCSTAGLFRPRNVDCNGPDYGVVWKGAYVSSTFRAASSPNYVNPLFFTATMNVAGGFDSRLSFDYAGTELGGIAIYSGLNGKGTLLASSSLPGTVGTCGSLVCWDFVDLRFSGTAKSAIFAGLPVLSGFDNVTIGVPEPATVGMFGLGLLMLGMLLGRRRRTN